MSRSNRTARQAGAGFEQAVAGYLAWALDDGRIERRRTNGAKDRGDITGVMLDGQRVVLECKDVSNISVAEYLDEAETEAGNDGALFWMKVQKRRGVGLGDHEHVGRQLVVMTLEQLALILSHGLPLGPEEE